MAPRIVIHVLALMLLSSWTQAAELVVDQAAPADGDGSAAKPFKTIGEAVKIASGGDTITVRASVYAESVALSQSGTAEQPTVLRAVPGQRVIVSGFVSITGWQPYRDEVYTTTVDWPARDLFVGYRMQPVSRWPDLNSPWRQVSEIDANAGTLRDGQGLTGDKLLEPVAAKPAGARLYLYVKAGNTFSEAPFSGLDLAAGILATPDPRRLGSLRGEGNRYQLTNHVDLICKPGEWAYEPLDEKGTRLYFRPRDPADLSHTQARRPDQRLVYVGHWRDTVAHVRVEGLEVTGCRGMGIQVGNTDHATVAGCIVHNNGGNGIAVRRTAFTTVTGNVVFANGSGVSVCSSHDAVVENNEVASNMVDGIVVAGNVTGKPDGEPTTKDVIVRRNYVHHHLLLGHPDNCQTYRGVANLTLEDNVFLWGGQALMTEETDRSTIRNCAILGTAAYAVIFGHGNASDWIVENTTLGLGGWGSISMTAKGYQLRNNLFFQNTLGLAETAVSDYNLYAPAWESQPMCLVSKPKWQTFQDPAQVAAAIGQETHSLRADPLFRNTPTRQAIMVWRDENTLDRLFVRQAGAPKPTDGFAMGDNLEINGDGILRRVTAVAADTLTFAPPLPALPLREAILWNWKDAKSCTLDLRPREGSPALKAGQAGRQAGCTLDLPAFQRGDFDADGRRDLPELPDDVKAAWPNPNALVLPVGGA